MQIHTNVRTQTHIHHIHTHLQHMYVSLCINTYIYVPERSGSQSVWEPEKKECLNAPPRVGKNFQKAFPSR